MICPTTRRMIVGWLLIRTYVVYVVVECYTSWNRVDTTVWHNPIVIPRHIWARLAGRLYGLRRSRLRWLGVRILASAIVLAPSRGDNNAF